MAPEIRKGKVYDGRSTDVFSLGVIIFVLVKGTFPFIKADEGDNFFKEIKSGNFDYYWSMLKCSGISDNLKDLL